jgi:hypothetical protein
MRRRIRKKTLLFVALASLAFSQSVHAANSLLTIGAGASITGGTGTNICADERSFIGSFNGIWCGGPLLVALTAFAAQGLADGVFLRWETASELDNAGFHLWRSERPDGRYARITPELIPAEGGPAWGAEYTYEDTDVRVGRTYSYKIEDVEYSSG